MSYKMIWFICWFVTFSGMAPGFTDANSIGEPNVAGFNEPNMMTLMGAESIEPNLPVKETKIDIPVAAPVEPEVSKSVEPVAAFDPNDPNTFPPVKPELLPGEEEVKFDGAVTLTVAEASELPGLEYRLLPAGFDLKDGDAADIYVEALKALPKETDSEKLNNLLETKIDELNINDIEILLESFEETLKLVNDAGCLKACDWNNQERSSKQAELHNGLKKLTQIVALKSRIQIAKEEFAGAVATIRSGLAMSRYIADCDNMVQGVLGVSSASIILEQVEALVQAQGSPCLFRPLQDLPRPLINLKINLRKEIVESSDRKQTMGYDLYGLDGMGMMASEIPIDLDGEKLLKEKDFDKPHEKTKPTSYSNSSVESLMKRLDRMVCALQCVEGVRYYISTYGCLPKKLSDIRELRLPADPVTTLPFWYRNLGSKAVLLSPLTESKAKHKRIIRYEIQLNERILNQEPETADLINDPNS